MGVAQGICATTTVGEVKFAREFLLQALVEQPIRRKEPALAAVKVVECALDMY